MNIRPNDPLIKVIGKILGTIFLAALGAIVAEKVGGGNKKLKG